MNQHKDYQKFTIKMFLKRNSFGYSAIVVFAIVFCACSANAEDVDAATSVEGRV